MTKVETMNKTISSSLFAGMTALALGSCGTSSKAQDDAVATKPTADAALDEGYTVSQSEEENLFLSQEERNLVEQNNDFALKFFQNTVGKSSYVASPLSITYLMAMLADGADGQTQKEMLQTLGWKDAKLTDIDALCRMLIDNSGKLDKSTTINIANYIALNKNAELRKDYVAKVQQNYLAGVESLDFNSSKSTERINGWCNKQTDGMIPSIIDQVDPSATLYALNAIFFNGSWTDKFNKNLTREENFRGYTRDIKKVQMMRMSHDFDYYESDSLQAVTLPYGNGAYEMTVILPREGVSVAEMLQGMDAKSLSSFRYKMDECKVDLKFPRFTIEQKLELNDVISAMGSPSMFTSLADFSKMSGDQLYVSQMFQKAKIEVTEEGTKAAAVTAAVMMLTSLNPPEPRRVRFYADHPFVYVITQRASGAILFIGQYAG